MKGETPWLREFIGGGKGVVEKYLKNNNDYISIITGQEGSGKSSLAFCLSHLTADYGDSKFDLENVNFYPDETRLAADKLPERSPLEIDEGSNIFNKYESMTEKVRETVKKLTMMREYNLHTIICISDIYELHKYFKEHRMQEGGVSLFRVTSRGHAWWIGNKGTRIVGKQLLDGNFSWGNLDSNIRDKIRKMTFPDYLSNYPDFTEKYLERKSDAIKEGDQEKETKITKKKLVQAAFKANPDARNIDLAKVFDTDPNYISRIKSMMDIGD